MKLRAVAIILLVATAGLPLFAANVSVPSLELITRGAMTNGVFNLDAYSNVELVFEGGAKFGGKIEFQFESSQLQRNEDLPASYDQDILQRILDRKLGFKAISGEVRRLFDLPLNLSMFTGELDSFCTGDDFVYHFGAKPFSSNYRGYGYFPTGIRYDGIHRVNGTGFKLETFELLNWLSLALYTYQDNMLGPGLYSSDFRLLLNLQNFKLEFFAGASYPTENLGIYRAGALLFYSLTKGTELLLAVGVPRFDPLIDTTITLDHFYLLLEPRVRAGLFSVVLSAFIHPAYYEQRATSEGQTIDLNFRLQLGDVTESLLSGGLETNVALRSPSSSEQVAAKVLPFLSINASGIIWDIKVGVRVFPFDMANLLEAFIGIKTEM